MNIYIFVTIAFSLAVSESMAQDTQVSLQREDNAIDWAGTAYSIKNKSIEDPRLAASTRATFPQQSELDKTRLPVLLMGGTEEFRSSPQFRQQGTSYVGSYKLKGANLSILGSGVSIRVDHSPDLVKAAVTTTKFDVLEDVTDLSLERFGATYVLRLSCQKPEDDRCTKPDFLTELSNALFFVGGTP